MTLQQTIAEALHEAQAVMSGAKKNAKNPFYKSDYANLASVIEAVKQAFYENGLAVTQTMRVLENGRTTLKTILMHVNGGTIESEMMLPDNTNPQEVGKNITYYRRYMLLSIAGIPGEDDDSQSFSNQLKKQKEQEKHSKQTITDDEWFKLDTFLNGHEELRSELKKLCSVDELRHISKTQLKICGDYARKYKERAKNEKNEKNVA